MIRLPDDALSSQRRPRFCSLRSSEGANAKRLPPLFCRPENKDEFRRRVPECFLALPPTIVRTPPRGRPPAHLQSQLRSLRLAPARAESNRADEGGNSARQRRRRRRRRNKSRCDGGKPGCCKNYSGRNGTWPGGNQRYPQPDYSWRDRTRPCLMSPAHPSCM